jgi:hypothetical protein
MARVALVLSIAACVFGLIGVFSPTTLVAIGRAFISPGGLLAAAAIRVVFGTVLILAAPASRAPRAIRVVGLFIVVAGVITPFFGVERARAVLDWWSSQGAALIRLGPAVILAGGCLLIYLLAPRRRAA